MQEFTTLFYSRESSQGKVQQRKLLLGIQKILHLLQAYWLRSASTEFGLEFELKQNEEKVKKRLYQSAIPNFFAKINDCTKEEHSDNDIEYHKVNLSGMRGDFSTQKIHKL